MRASLASLLVTSLALSTLPHTAEAGGAAKRPKKAAPKKAKGKGKGKGATPPAETPPADGATAGSGDGAGSGSADAQPASALDGAGGTTTTTTTSGGLGGTTTPSTPATPPPTPASGPTPGSPEAKDKAKGLGKEATRLYNVQKYEQAADLYQEAYLLDPNPAYLYAAAQSQRLGGDCTKALQSYQAYLRANPPESERAKAQANIDRCQQDIAEREATANAEAIHAPYDVPPPPPPPPEEVHIVHDTLPPLKKTYIAGHIMLGLGVVAAAGGTYLYLDGHKKLSDHNSAGTYEDYVGGLADVDTAKRNQKYGIYAMAGGGALITGAIIFYVVHARKRREAPPPVQAAVLPGGATITFARNF